MTPVTKGASTIIGIDIDVKSEKVARAQKLIEQMSKSLDDVGNKAEIKIGPETIDMNAVNVVSKGAAVYRDQDAEIHYRHGSG